MRPDFFPAPAQRCFLFFALLILGAPAFAQLTGKVVDEKGTALAFANISVLRSADSSLSGSAISGPDGKFSVLTPAAGNYILRLTAIGFFESRTPAFEVGSTAFSKDF